MDYQRRTNNILNGQSYTDADDCLSRMIKAEILVELHSLIHSLPLQCSKVFTKIYIKGKSVADTAEELGMSVNTVKSHKARGLSLLRGKVSSLVWIWLMTFPPDSL
jgi:RNA polymerase sigma-70 factor (ECF subfamily)